MSSKRIPVALILYPEPGCDIHDAMDRALHVAKVLQVQTRFEFNGVTVICGPSGDLNTGYTRFREILEGRAPLKFLYVD